MKLFKNIVVYMCLTVTLFANRKFDYYLANNQIDKALDVYLSESQEGDKHNYLKLKAIAHRLLESGAKSPIVQEQMLTIYGLQIAQKMPTLSILDNLITTANPGVQIACLHLLDHLNDDRTALFYEKGLKSSYLQVRFQSIIHLVLKNDPNAFGTLSSLINLIPPHYHPSLVELFAILNCDSARHKLKTFLGSLNPMVRLAAIKAITDHNLDEFIVDCRRFLTHTDPKLKEAALNFAKKHHDIKAKHDINLATKSPYKHVKIAALLAQKHLSGVDISNQIISMAKEKDLFAIAVLENIKNTNQVLELLAQDKKMDVRYNAGMCLLNQKKPSCTPIVKEILTIDPNYLCIYPHTSAGMTLSCIKTTPLASFSIESQKNFYKLQTQHFLEQVLSKSINLDEDDFLSIVKSIFDKRQLHLVPLAFKLLENRNTLKTEKYIHELANCIAAPLIRSYARLSLYKKDKNCLSKMEFYSLIDSLKHVKIVEFDESNGISVDPKTNATQFDLSIQQKSSLFLQALELLLQEHDAKALTCLVKALKNGDNQNRYILAGLIIKCLE